MLMDILVAREYANSEENQDWAVWIYFTIGFSLIMHASFAIVCKQRWRDVFAALVDFKPMLETWRVITGAPTPPGQLYPNETMLTNSRIVEVVFELVPQAVLQGYIVLQTRNVTSLQLGSLFGSCFASGFILANASFARRNLPSTVSD